jgi:hypothetical protein
VCLKRLFRFLLTISRFVQVSLHHTFVSNHRFYVSVIRTRLYSRFYVLGIIYDLCVSLILFVSILTFIEDISFILSSVLSYLLGSVCFLCMWLCSIA